MANSVSGQDGAILPARDHALCPARKISPKPKQKACSKSFVDQTCLVKISGVLASLFFCMFIDLNIISVHKNTQKRTWPTSNHLHLTLGP